MGSGDAVPCQPDEDTRLCRAAAVLCAELGFLDREGPSLHGLTELGVRLLFRQQRSTQIAHSPLREVLTLPQRCLGRHGFREPVLRERTPDFLPITYMGGCGIG